MKDIIKLCSRDGINNYLKLTRLSTHNKGTYLLVTEYDYIRVMEDKKTIIYIDPPGGPSLVIGNILRDIDQCSSYKIINIGFSSGYQVELEEITDYEVKPSSNAKRNPRF